MIQSRSDGLAGSASGAIRGASTGDLARGGVENSIGGEAHQRFVFARILANSGVILQRSEVGILRDAFRVRSPASIARCRYTRASEVYLGRLLLRDRSDMAQAAL